MSASRAREQERERLVAMAYTLYKGTSAWGLPSYSAASIQVEVGSGHWLTCQEQFYLTRPLPVCPD